MAQRRYSANEVDRDEFDATKGMAKRMQANDKARSDSVLNKLTGGPGASSGPAASSTEQARAKLSQERGAMAARIKDPEAKRQYIRQQGDAEADERKNGLGATPGNQFNDVRFMTNLDREEGGPSPDRKPSVPSFKRGGTMPRSGKARLHKGERAAGRGCSR